MAMGLIEERLENLRRREGQEQIELEELSRARAQVAEMLGHDFSGDIARLFPAVQVSTKGAVVSLGRGDLVRNAECLDIICISDNEFRTEYRGRKIDLFAKSAASIETIMSKEETLDNVLIVLERWETNA